MSTYSNLLDEEEVIAETSASADNVKIPLILDGTFFSITGQNSNGT